MKKASLALFAVLSLIWSGFAAPPVRAQQGNQSTKNGGAAVSNGIFVTTSDILWNQWTGAFTADIYTSFRIQTADGTIYDSTAQGTSWTATACAGAGGGTGTGKTFPVSGWLINVTSLTQTTGIPLGQAYANFYILPTMPTGGTTANCVATLANANIGNLIMGAPVSSFYPMAWQAGGGNLVQPSISTIPFSATQTITTPGSAANFSNIAITTGGQRTCIQAVTFRLVTSASAGNRVAAIQVTDGTFNFFWYIAPTAQVASTTEIYSFAPGASAATTTIAGPITVQTVPFNNGVPICTNNLGTLQISSQFAGLLAGDQIDTIAVRVLKYGNEIN